MNHLIALHEAEAANAAIGRIEKLNDHPTLERHTTVVQSADTTTQLAV